MSAFEIGKDVAENVEALRKFLGSALRVLSRDDLADIVARNHSTRAPNGTTVQRWEEGKEPDYESTRIMAAIAGVTFEQFALGRAAAIPIGLPDITKDRKLSAVEEGRAVQVGGREAAARKRKKTSKRRRAGGSR